MKTPTFLFLTLCCAMSLCLNSCSKDYSKMIVGDWERYALYWTYSGSPYEDENYSSGGHMESLVGAGLMRCLFSDDNTGMIINSYIDDSGNLGIDTMRFTYSIAGDDGTITPVSDNGKGSSATTYTIRDIEKDRMTLYERRTIESHYYNDTATYTRIFENEHIFKKIKN